MGTYLAVGVRSARRYTTYRAATLAGVFTNTCFGFFRAYVLVAVWQQRPHLGGYDLTDALTYCFLGQAFIAVVAVGGPLELTQRIRTGDVVIDLLRPIDMHAYWLSQDLGRAALQLATRGVLPFAAGALVFNLELPDTPLRVLEAAAALAVGAVVSFDLRYLTSLAAFWLLDSRGIANFVQLTAYFCCGLAVPLVIVPGWIGTVLRSLPFATILQFPIDVTLGRAGTSETLLAILWLVVMTLLARGLTRLAVSKLVVQGG